MKFVHLVVFVIITAQNVQPLEISSNFTIPDQLLANLTDFFMENAGNQSITLADLLFSDMVEEVLFTYGYGDLAEAITNLDKTITIFNQLGQIQQIVDQFGDIDKSCLHQLALFVGSLDKMDEWALRMFDATAKVQPGLLEGNIMLVGNYDECLKIDVVVNGSQINGQYCTALFSTGEEEQQFNPSLKKDLLLIKQSYGFCVPAVCNKSSLNKVARLVEKALNSSLHFTFIDNLCMSNVKPKTFSSASIVCITFFAAVGFIVIVSTFYDIYFCNNEKHHGISLLTAFSFYTNGKKLFTIKKSADSLGCLNGMKVISIAWIISGHRYMYSSFLPLINSLDAIEWTTKAASGLITAGNMAVDTFFVISGLLVAYVYLLHKEKGQSVALGMFYIHRFLRLTPALAALVWFYATLLDYLGTGPFWPVIDIFQSDCQRYWWSTLLYVQNYVNSEGMCISQSWYLAVDTQLYFLSPLLLIPLVRWPRRTISCTVCLVFICCVLTFITSWQKELTPAFFELTDEGMKYLYAAVYVRAPAWLAGFILGYILFQIRNKKIILSKAVQILLWLASLLLMAAVVAYHKRIAGSVEDLLVLEIAFANSLLRLVWSVALSVVIFLCVTGHGGVVNQFLSSPIFTVLIRINYSVYLVHMLVITFSLGQIKTPQYSSFMDNFYYFWGDYIITSLLAIVWTLSFESPVLIIEKLLFGKQKPKTAVQATPESYNNNINVIVIENKLENNGKSNKFCNPSTE